MLRRELVKAGYPHKHFYWHTFPFWHTQKVSQLTVHSNTPREMKIYENLFHFPFLVTTVESFLLQMRNVKLHYPKDRNTDINGGRRLHTTHNSYWSISYHKVTGQNRSAWSQISNMSTNSGSLGTVLFCFLCVLSNLMSKHCWYLISIICCCQVTVRKSRARKSQA